MSKYFLLALAFLLPSLSRAEDEQPILTLHTSIYETYGTSNSFHLTIGLKEAGYLDVDCGFGTMEVECGQAVYVDSLQAIQGTAIPCTVSQRGEVKIYGDASQIDYLGAEGCYITDIDLSRLTALEILDLGHNELRGLDLTPQTRLQALYLDDNPMRETGLTVGTPKADLTILEMGRIEKMNAFNLSDYPALVSFDAWANTGLHSIDPTGCPQLKKISIDSCPIETIDVSQNPLLQILNVSDSGVDSLDLSHNTNLLQLYAAHTSDFLYTDRKFRSLDLTPVPNLIYLYCGGNMLRTLDITGLHYLQTLACQENLLETLDITKNTNLLSVSLQNNYFGFRDLPLPSDDWSEYYYYQRPMGVSRCVAAGTPIDFTRQLKEGTTTTVTVSMRQPEAPDDPIVLRPDTDYTWVDGHLTVLAPQADSLRVTFANDAFTEYQLQSAWFMVKDSAAVGQPTCMLSFVPKQKGSVTFSASMTDKAQGMYVDMGDHQFQPFAAGLVAAPMVGDTVRVYAPEGSAVSGFALEGTVLESIDLSQAPALARLTLVGTGLTELDLRANRALRTLRLDGNQLGDFSLAGYNGSYEKTTLDSLVLTNDGLTGLTLIEPMALRYVDLSHNQLTELTATTNMDNVTSLNVADNQLTKLNLLNCAAMRRLQASGNYIYEIQQPEKPSLEEVDITGNSYTLANLPDFATATDYRYAPQRAIKISAKGPGANLSAQYVVKDGQATQFQWVKEDGTALAEGTDYTIENGVTRFVNTDAGRVVCRMTHAAYPQFSVEGQQLTTTPILTAPMPTHVLASFRTSGDTLTIGARATRADQSLYVDWTGLRADLAEYALSADGFVEYQAPTVANAEVKVYTYAEDAPISVFGLYGAPLSSVDLTGLDALQTLSVTDAQLSLDDIRFPEQRASIIELNLSGNRLTSFPLADYPNLSMLNLSGNQFTTIDLSPLPRLGFASLSHNKLTDVTFANPMLWSLDLAYNELDTVDFTGAESLEQIAIFENRLTGVDVAKLKALRYLDVSSNRMTIATLPLLPAAVNYVYGNQQPMTVECTRGQVDLTAQASRNGQQTSYRWFIDAPTFDDEGNLVGEELVLDEEYTLTNGLTTFLSDPGDRVMCVMQNPLFPRLYLTTTLMTATPDGVEEIKDAKCKMQNCFDLSGRRVTQPRHGLYIIDGRKVAVK